MTRRAEFGSIISGTLREADLLEAFASELARLSDGLDVSDDLDLIRSADDCDPDNSEDDADEASELIEALSDALQSYAPAYAYFGAHPGDGADFGFWLAEDWEQQAKDDGCLFVNDLSEVPDDLGVGELVCVVNDHGNATLYSMAHEDGRAVPHELWSIV